MPIAIPLRPTQTEYDALKAAQWHVAATAPTVNDDVDAGYLDGAVWLDTSTSPITVYVLLDGSSGAAVWREAVVADANGDVTLNGVVCRVETAASMPTLDAGELGYESDTTRYLGGTGGNNLVLTGIGTDWGVTVQAVGTASENGTALITAFNTAKALTPGGSAVSATNRVAVLVSPGHYDLGSSQLTWDTEGVSLIGLGAREDVWIESSHATEMIDASETVHIERVTLRYTQTASSSYTINFSSAPSSQNVFRDVVFNRADTKANVHSDDINFDARFDRCKQTNDGGTGGYFLDSDFTTSIVTINAVFHNCEALGDLLSSGGGSNQEATITVEIIDSTATNGALVASHNAGSGYYDIRRSNFSLYPFIDVLSGHDGLVVQCVAQRFFNAGYTGRLVDCVFESTSEPIGNSGNPFAGEAVNCRCVTTGTNKSAIYVTDGARLYNCTAIATGTGYSINAGSAVNVSIAHCRLNTDIHANVTNDVANGYNVVDANIT